ncbi:TIGR03086 family protein [Nocardia panacis]|uniref:TIGR03086 family protein n=1 Tax=Nocardia panacis TaxID=2340916 RepID=A0A3A4L7G9_9NOCA|nr:TIGR03086 family metal-binding protein [Nocardia panacis]RJO78832.1 TIGR03086 family protein [Nocardia panacis]
MSTVSELVALHERALRLTTDLVAGIAADQLDNETPCAKWDLRALLTHMTIQNHGFAEAALGRGNDLALWETRELADPVAEYLTASAELSAAFAAPDLAERELVLLEMRTDGGFPPELAVRFQIVDCVVHAWDVARAIGASVSLDDDPELAAESRRIAEFVPGGEIRLTENAPFGPMLEVPEGAGTLDRILLLLGRDPQWAHA